MLVLFIFIMNTIWCGILFVMQLHSYIWCLIICYARTHARTQLLIIFKCMRYIFTCWLHYPKAVSLCQCVSSVSPVCLKLPQLSIQKYTLYLCKWVEVGLPQKPLEQLEWAVSAPDGRFSFALIWKSFQVYEYFSTPTQAKISQNCCLKYEACQNFKGNIYPKMDNIQWQVY